MGHSKAAKTTSHDRILDVAAHRFRERGFDGVGVAELMKEAGLTHGGFYKHFASRDALVAEATTRAFESVDQRFAARTRDDSRSRLESFLDAYLAATHRDDPGDGCAIATLAIDVARHPPARETFAAHFSEVADRVAGLLSCEKDWARGAAVICALAGAISVARAIDDRRQSDAILEAMHRLILAAEPG